MLMGALSQPFWLALMGCEVGSIIWQSIGRIGGEVSLDYRAARAYHWFSKDDLERFPLMPHVLAYAARALDELSPGPVRGDVEVAPVAGR